MRPPVPLKIRVVACSTTSTDGGFANLGGPAPSWRSQLARTLGAMAHRSRPTRRRAIALAAAALLVAPLAVACSSDGDDAAEVAAGQPAAEVALDEGRTVIDVRTPEEFNAGHIDGAVLFDIQGDEFGELIASLDQEDEYVVYCRTGNRSAVATEEMRELGLDVLDGGALEDMTAAGWPTA